MQKANAVISTHPRHRPQESRRQRKSRPAGRQIQRYTARMLKKDLAAARRQWLRKSSTDAERAERQRSDFLQYQDADGRYADFHAQRHTHISAIVAGGASVKTAQELARHSTPTLTIGRYSHARLHDLTAALEALPDLTTPAATTATAEVMAATGTDGETAEVLRGQKWEQYNRKSTQEAANRGERPDDFTTAETAPANEQEPSPNVLPLRTLATRSPHPAGRGEKRRARDSTGATLQPVEDRALTTESLGLHRV